MTKTIAELNDLLVSGDNTQQWMITDGVQALPKELQVQLVQLVKLRQLHPRLRHSWRTDFGEVVP